MIRQGFFLVLAFAAGLACAQQYRWIDKDGRPQYGDAPPPGAKDLRKSAAPAPKPAESAGAAGAVPFEIARLQRDFPVTLYTAPSCKEGCELARAALNKRGVPFKEVQAWDADTTAELKRVTGSDQVPALVVGREMQRGFEQGAFDALLDTAGYPKTGLMPALSQKAPPLPEDYVAPGEHETVKSPAQPAAATVKAGPYDTSGLKGPPPKPGIYDASGLQGPPPKPGQYGLPGQGK
ncbi:MAG: DUF4124 domain-containing protein [Burkholderiales bacterium]